MPDFDTDCPFCVDALEATTAASTLAYAVADRYPVTPLHTLVIPRRHVADYFGLTEDELLACHALLHHLRETILAADPDVSGFNIGLNVGATAGQTIFHCHFHLIPRRAGDVANPRGGVRHIIPGKGNY